MDDIEARVLSGAGVTLPPVGAGISLGAPHRLTLVSVAHTLIVNYPGRTALGVVLMASQAFIYNAIFFTYALVLAKFYGGAADLQVGESLPREVRALTIALFYAFGTLLGGVGGPWLFGVLIQGEGRDGIVLGYLLGAALMGVAVVVELILGVKAERKPLEEV